MPVKLDIPDKRMLELAAWAVANQYADSEGDYWQAIGFARTSISKVRSGTQSFTVAQIIAACKLTGASADWILGLDKTMFREGTAKTPADLIRQALVQLEQKNGRH